jgi:hypothetical protein
MSQTLKLTVNKVWFDMIKSGEKKEEYREIKSYWFQRLVFQYKKVLDFYQRKLNDNSIWLILFDKRKMYGFVPFDFIEFKNGYSKNAPTITLECKGIEIGMPEMKWSGTMFCDDEGQVDDCFIINIGNEISRSNC